ncbi:tyrosine-protein kinase transmembrane receptor Ror-like [Sipha flava]|uniref:Tyrosine-protein kinase transmembrane receptor Ror-like n=1 Tax=Sipha flava TaxID=143950 RepID=A0A8B8GN78_9HEMI|nr:tyrosine-protein kinase transmembrane receptor Ror-like [Sipha flava]
MHIGRHKRLTASDGRRVGSCFEMKPCGLEAACQQLDETFYKCVCPQDASQPTDDLKCPTRKTVPVFPKSFVNLSINKNEHASVATKTRQSTTTSQPIKTTTAINQTAPLPRDVTSTGHTIDYEKQLDIRLLGFAFQINLMIMVTAIVAIAFLLLILAVCWSRSSKGCCRKKNVKPKSLVVPLMKGMIQDECYALNPQYAAPSPAVDAKNTILIPYLSKSCISSMQEIGQGYFGKVYKGVLRHNDGKLETVAIKVLKDHTNAEAKEDFMREVEIMTYFRHPNILTLIGVCPQEDVSSPWMIFEYMAYGDLTEVLRNSNEQFTNRSLNLPIVDKDALLIISLQISAGMKYLATQRFVHRDLACRNCLVGHDLTVKIADFGMSRDIYTCDYYKVGGSRLLPVRWMSPESVVYGKFTLESDVWSFGVVLWEIYSLGKQPYYGYSNDEVLKLIHDGVLLDIPLDCPPVICVLMNGCWKSDPKERLRFVDVHDRLKNVTKRPELDSPLPRPPALPSIVDHLSLKKIPSEELLDVENYLRPDDPGNNVEYITPFPY